MGCGWNELLFKTRLNGYFMLSGKTFPRKYLIELLTLLILMRKVSRTSYWNLILCCAMQSHD